MCDFRMCGRLSRLIKNGRLQGTRGETLLIPVGKKLPFKNLVLYGLGPSNEFDERVASEVSRALVKLAAGLQVSRYAVVLPGRSLGVLSLRRALGLFLAAAGRQADVLIIEPISAQKEAGDLLPSEEGAAP